MDSAFIHQAANELVQNAGTRNIKHAAHKIFFIIYLIKKG